MKIEDAIDKEITYLLNYAADILDEQIRRRDRIYGLVNLEATRLQITSYKRILKDLKND
jgi:hypothetical protein